MVAGLCLLYGARLNYYKIHADTTIRNSCRASLGQCDKISAHFQGTEDQPLMCTSAWHSEIG